MSRMEGEGKYFVAKTCNMYRPETDQGHLLGIFSSAVWLILAYLWW